MKMIILIGGLSRSKRPKLQFINDFEPNVNSIIIDYTVIVFSGLILIFDSQNDVG